MRAEHHRNRTGSHQSAKSHRSKINGKVLTKKYLPAGMSFVPVPVALADRHIHWSLSDLLLTSKCKNSIKRKICNVTQCRKAKGGALRSPSKFQRALKLLLVCSHTVYICMQRFYSLKYIISLSCCTAQYLHPLWKINQPLELPEYSTEAKNLFT